jgi:hypothetical protein
VIGVRCRAEQTAAVEEFFQLWKTPWERWEPGCAYDVVIATTDDVPDVERGLLVVYGAHATRADERWDVQPGRGHAGGCLTVGDVELPIIGELLTFADGQSGTACLVTTSGAIAGHRVRRGDVTLIRLGYDLFDEVRTLLAAGQPAAHAHVPTLDIHVAMLRGWVLDAGFPVLEIPPAPSGHPFVVCLTHDIDFAGIRYHRFDHTMWGFLYRSTVGALVDLLRGRTSLARCWRSWRAAGALPLVHLGWARDFWEPFAWYLRVERPLPATYFLIPFKGRAGERVADGRSFGRAAGYDVADLAPSLAALRRARCELAVHGIDAWHSAERGREERRRIAAVAGRSPSGIRVHWLLREADTPRVLEDAGYAWDASLGYNETVGYCNGTSQPFRPLGAIALLELPLHIQDGALFFPRRLGLTDAGAWRRCEAMIENARRYGGALTVLWHDRSHAPERFWGDFYVRLLGELRARGAWFATASDVVEWFRDRRDVRFARAHTAGGVAYVPVRARRGPADGGQAEGVRPALAVRIHRPRGASFRGRGHGHAPWIDVAWEGAASGELAATLAGVLSSLRASIADPDRRPSVACAATGPPP